MFSCQLGNFQAFRRTYETLVPFRRPSSEPCTCTIDHYYFISTGDNTGSFLLKVQKLSAIKLYKILKISLSHVVFSHEETLGLALSVHPSVRNTSLKES